MTIILKRRPPVEVALMEGLVLTVRPAGQIDWDLAAARAGRNAGAIGEGGEAMARYGVAGSPADIDDADRAFTLRVSTAGLAIELGAAHILAWRGPVLDDGATPAPVTAGNIALLFNACDEAGVSFGKRFLDRMRGLSILEPAAGNASAASPAIAGAEAATSAADAAPTATPAPAAGG